MNYTETFYSSVWSDFTDTLGSTESQQCTGDCCWRGWKIISDFRSVQSTQTERRSLEKGCYCTSQAAPQSPITSGCVPISVCEVGGRRGGWRVLDLSLEIMTIGLHVAGDYTRHKPVQILALKMFHLSIEMTKHLKSGLEFKF